MPIRLIGSIILLVLVTIFAGVNLDNKCNINFVFRELEAVPVFMTAIISFVAGMIVTLPFTFGRRRKNQKKAEEQKKQGTDKKPELQAPKTAQSPKEESKTLFDFKIKRDVKTENENSEKPKKDKKSLFSFGKKIEKDSADSAKSGNTENSSGTGTTSPSESHASDAETGAPV